MAVILLKSVSESKATETPSLTNIMKNNHNVSYSYQDTLDSWLPFIEIVEYKT